MYTPLDITRYGSTLYNIIGIAWGVCLFYILEHPIFIIIIIPIYIHVQSCSSVYVRKCTGSVYPQNTIIIKNFTNTGLLVEWE